MSEFASLTKGTLKVRAVKHYGHLTVYPLDSLSRLFCELLGQKTLTQENCNTIKKLGFEFEVENEKVKI